MPPIELGTAALDVCVPNPIVFEYDEQSVVILDPDRPAWLKTSATGKWIFDLLRSKPLTADRLIAETSAHYSLPESVIAEPVNAFLQQLETEGFLSRAGASAGPTGRGFAPAAANSSAGLDNLRSDTLAAVRINIVSGYDLSSPPAWSFQEAERSRFISLSMAERILDALSIAAPRRIYVTGGEPFLHPELPELLRLARERGTWQIRLVTSGMTNDFARLERVSALVDYFEISMSGTDAATHDSIRGAGSFEKVRDLFGSLRKMESKAKRCICFVPDPRNIGQIRQLLAFALEIGAHWIKLVHPKRYVRNSEAGGFADELMSSEFRRRIYEQYDALVETYYKLSRELTYYRRDPKGVMIDSSFDPALGLLLRAKRTSCGAGECSLFVDGQGDCYPCSALSQPDHRLGNLLEKPWEQIYGDGAALRFRQAIHVEGDRECGGCAFKYFCGGHCHALTEDVRQRTPYCELVKGRFHQFLKAVRFWTEMGAR